MSEIYRAESTKKNKAWRWYGVNGLSMGVCSCLLEEDIDEDFRVTDVLWSCVFLQKCEEGLSVHTACCSKAEAGNLASYIM